MKSTHSQGSFRCTGCRILQHLKRPEIFEFPFKARFSQDIQAQMKPLKRRVPKICGTTKTRPWFLGIVQWRAANFDTFPDICGTSTASFVCTPLTKTFFGVGSPKIHFDPFLSNIHQQQYPASFSESLGDHELKLPFFVRFLKVSFLWPRKKWMPFYSENPTGGKVLHTKPYQCWMRFAEAMGRKFWAKSSTHISMDVLEDSQYLLISTCEENLPKDSQRIPETCTPKPPSVEYSGNSPK